MPSIYTLPEDLITSRIDLADARRQLFTEATRDRVNYGTITDLSYRMFPNQRLFSDLQTLNLLGFRVWYIEHQSILGSPDFLTQNNRMVGGSLFCHELAHANELQYALTHGYSKRIQADPNFQRRHERIGLLAQMSYGASVSEPFVEITHGTAEMTLGFTSGFARIEAAKSEAYRDLFMRFPTIFGIQQSQRGLVMEDAFRKDWRPGAIRGKVMNELDRECQTAYGVKSKDIFNLAIYRQLRSPDFFSFVD